MISGIQAMNRGLETSKIKAVPTCSAQFCVQTLNPNLAVCILERNYFNFDIHKYLWHFLTHNCTLKFSKMGAGGREATESVLAGGLQRFTATQLEATPRGGNHAAFLMPQPGTGRDLRVPST